MRIRIRRRRRDPADDGEARLGLTRRRKLLFAGLAVAAAITVFQLLIDTPGGTLRNPPPRVDRPLCTPGQTVGCVGGTQGVLVAPPAAAPASAASAR